MSELRIIGGVWRRHKLPVAAVEGLRPTPDRVRETVFNWLGQDCTGMEVLDLYAGTGALGFEAASRGASSVLFVEQNRKVLAQLQENRAYLLSKWVDAISPKPNLQVDSGDALATMKRLATSGKRFDLVALDPPFRSELMHATLPSIPNLLKQGGLVYAEWHENLFADEPALCKALNVQEIEALRHLKAGQVHAHLFALPAV
ncbi:16S rRNA (guanine(966)-N(2))-methyltransferase RsmD [Limnobacter parvus]|uniref:16S rRNA (Guanine(966)-N(2))-methyltransferase RsmD n=1 Tax=Limnobacter parvus TaxID=2939690 RepID=A0ABT1XD28_9BURK|nr:16S rRNA (guanine(966)-N(2))-methyltransferase RsmD [Limnobacter parvus]MCR2745178.1 16S rRNA (guanine(966)-N(2))-methyltransferase RsmD [Limnobacter parvus]